MVTVWRNALRAGVVLACLSVVGLAAPVPASAADGFATELSGLPDEFSAGDQVSTLSAVVSRNDGGRCVKVRWSMVLSVRGLRLDQVKVDRVEDSGSFPLQIQTEGDIARLTDRQLDPGTLCPDRTVTARYRVAFAEDIDRGRVTLAAEAYDANLRLLARQSVTRNVVGLLASEASATPEPSGSAVAVDPTEPVDASAEPTEEAVAQVPPAAGRPVAGATGGFGLVQAAFLLGGLLLFLGAGLLLKLRQLNRASRGGEADLGGPAYERARRTGRWGAARR
ncbi:hypothetical protein FHX75_14232 [Micromonospora palomenae]|uniref:Uncharacterized protein n=1 Tax=Micromonospora palomenae TaxID=1461247 RepID=A0A561VK02_9ACTN|nr:hypothetical protein FHX75_14232 [Micromonospora palomenae]